MFEQSSLALGPMISVTGFSECVAMFHRIRALFFLKILIKYCYYAELRGFGMPKKA